MKKISAVLIPAVCLIVGILLGILLKQPVKGPAGLYLAVACLAGLDTICGGLRSNFEQKFHADVFLSGFFGNVLIAFGLSWLGDRIGTNVFLVCAFIFGTRIFNNLSLIRRFWLSRLKDARDRAKQDLPQSQSSTPISQASQSNNTN